jgi:hypothetical protein
LSRSLRVSIDPATVSPARAIAATARTGPLVCLTGRAFRDLADELGGTVRAMRHLMWVSENVNKPIAVNFPTGGEASRTVFLAPRSWTPERLRGWVAGHHEALEAMFGTARVREESDA